jgi:hypothetical protein
VKRDGVPSFEGDDFGRGCEQRVGQGRDGEMTSKGRWVEAATEQAAHGGRGRARAGRQHSEVATQWGGGDTEEEVER